MFVAFRLRGVIQVTTSWCRFSTKLINPVPMDWRFTRSFLGKRERRTSASQGVIPHFRNPAIKLFAEFRVILVHNWASIRGNSDFGRVVHFCPIVVHFHSPSRDRQQRFIGAKKATSRGWVKWVVLGGRNTNLMLCSLHLSRTLRSKWLDRLSQIRTFGPNLFLALGKKIRKNQFWNVRLSNQPLLLQSYLVPGGPRSVQVSHTRPALYLT